MKYAITVNARPAGTLGAFAAKQLTVEMPARELGSATYFQRLALVDAAKATGLEVNALLAYRALPDEAPAPEELSWRK